TFNTPFAGDLFRAGTNLPVDVGFHRGTPGQPDRNPREIVVEIVDPQGQAQGEPLTLSNGQVSWKDLGLLFDKAPIVVGASIATPRKPGTFAVRVAYETQSGERYDARQPFQTQAMGSTSGSWPLPSDSPGTFKIRFREPPDNRPYRPGELIPVSG